MNRRSPWILVLALLIVLAYYLETGGSLPDIPWQTPVPAVTVQATLSEESGNLPELAVKPEPVEITFMGCPPGGDGGDMIQNLLKNRIDESESYYTVDFQSILGLTWPESVERTDRINWTNAETDAIARFEGIPVSVVGYLAAATESGPESTNCHGTSNEMSDWHVTLVEDLGEDRSLGIVTETTPRVRINHAWTLNQLREIISRQERVRISGWLFFDPEHPDHIGKYRATLWEIHPIMKIEVFRNGSWMELP